MTRVPPIRLLNFLPLVADRRYYVSFLFKHAMVCGCIFMRSSLVTEMVASYGFCVKAHCHSIDDHISLLFVFDGVSSGYSSLLVAQAPQKKQLPQRNSHLHQTLPPLHSCLGSGFENCYMNCIVHQDVPV